MKGNNAVTITEIAKELGVSVTTVSRAVSGKGRIGEETRNKILNFINEQRMLQKQEAKTRTGNLGVVLPADVYISNEPYFQECILGICETAAIMDYDVVIATATTNDISGIQALVEKKKVDAIILTRSLEEDKAVRYLKEQDFLIGLTGDSEYDGIIQVDIDNEEASEMLTSYLIGEGYRKFAFITETFDYIVNKSRYKGFCKALEKNGIDKSRQIYYTNFLSVDAVDAVINDLIAQKIECVVCGDDVICTRLMSNLQAEGYRIPKDIAVASLYNSSNLNCFTPAVTTVNISAKKVGNAICKQVIHRLIGKEYQDRTKIDYEILVRKSTKGFRKGN
ncbi:MAG: LacI family transcriptional regulator [Lachnospiraceae bacterium]|nr:LacI family transcriptional regulator [Lachnospiraceae bacterium]